LPSNSALAIGENLDYVKVKTFNPYTYEPENVILAKARMGAYFNPKAAELKLEDYTSRRQIDPIRGNRGVQRQNDAGLGI
jgi:isoleucyl-tRNA synthetase